MGTMEGVESSSLEVEVMAKPMRRRYTAGYKLRILREADACTHVGEVEALQRENARLKARAERAEGLVELQKKSPRFWGSN